MSLKTCPDLFEAVPLEPSLGLYLKPISRIKINVQLPRLTAPGQSISSWHVIEKVKETVRPDPFLYLKALKIAPNVIKLEGELETKASCDRALARLRAASSLDVSGFAERLPVRAAHSQCGGPTRHDWEAFFRDAKGVNEMRPGERPDTLHLEEVPARWFGESTKSGCRPSEKLLQRAFGTFGKIRRLEIRRDPTITAKEESAFGKTSFGKTNSSLQNEATFEAYVQYEEYVEFSIAMDSLRGKKLLYKEPDGQVYSADIKVDFDRTNYLSDKCIKLREAEAKKLRRSISPERTKSSKEDKNSKVVPVEKSVIRETDKEKIPIKVDSLKEQEKTEAKLLLKELFERAEKFKKKIDSAESEASRGGHLPQKEPFKELPKTPTKTPELDRCVDLDEVVRGKKRSEKPSASKDVSSSLEKRAQQKEKEDSPRPDKRPRPAVESERFKKSQLLYEAKKEKATLRERDQKKHPHERGKGKDSATNRHHLMQKNSSCISPKKNSSCITLKKGSKLRTELCSKSKMEETEREKREKLILQERILKEKLLKNLKQREEEKLRNREKLRKELAGRKVLKSVLVNHSSNKKS